jgi:hypothetical protein
MKSGKKYLLAQTWLNKPSVGSICKCYEFFATHFFTNFVLQEDDEEDVDLRTSAAGTEAVIVGGHSGGQPGLGGLGHGGGHRGQLQPKQTTYLVDHHPQLFEPPSLTNYATMPRQPPGVNSL